MASLAQKTGLGGTLLILGIHLAAIGARATDKEPGIPPASGSDPLALDQYYGDAVSHIGSFPGHLVCISTEHSQVPENAVSCGADKIYALAVDKPAVVVPLIASSQAASAQLPTLLDHTVVVRGKHYPDKGMIAAASVESAGTAADSPRHQTR